MNGLLFLSASDVERVLTPRLCIDAVEDAFRQLAQGGIPAPGILGLHAGEGSFHVKAGLLNAPGRANDEEITVFDSTGTGLQDVAAAIAAYRGRAT